MSITVKIFAILTLAAVASYSDGHSGRALINKSTKKSRIRSLK